MLEPENALGALGELEIVGHEDQRGATLAVEPEDEFDHGIRRVAVQITRGFVAEQKARAIDEGAGQRNPLLFATGQADGIVIHALAEANPRQELTRSGLTSDFPAQLERNQHILQGGQGGDELEILEHEADGLVPHPGSTVLIHRPEVAAFHFNHPLAGHIQAGTEPEECGLATARWADNGTGLTSQKRERNLLEHCQRSGCGGVRLGEMLDIQDGLNTHWLAMPSTTLSPRKSAKEFVQRVLQLVGWLFGLSGLLAVFHVQAAESKTLVFFGDSLTAGAGVDPSEAYPAEIGRMLAAAGKPWRVVNAGLSGETTAGGLRRIDWVLRQPVDLIVLELGGNDGLRGIAPDVTRTNLQAIIDRIHATRPQAKIVLAGMQVPPNLGQEYTKAFANLFPELAARNHTGLIPFLLEGVGGIPELNQADGIHPTPEGHRKVAKTVWDVLFKDL